MGRPSIGRSRLCTRSAARAAMPDIMDWDLEPDYVRDIEDHRETYETESESVSEEGYLEESDTDTDMDAEYNLYIEDNDDADFDEEGDFSFDETENNSNSSEIDRSSSSSASTHSTASMKSSAPASESPPLSTCSGIQMVFEQLAAVFVIYLQFAMLAVLMYSVAVWYTLNYTDLDAEPGGKSSAAVSPDLAADSDTCPAGLVS